MNAKLRVPLRHLESSSTVANYAAGGRVAVDMRIDCQSGIGPTTALGSNTQAAYHAVR
jgi:hypothetical protein